MAAATSDVCCSPLWIGFVLGVSGSRFVTGVLVLWSAAALYPDSSALYRISASRDRDHLLVRWYKAGRSRGLDLVAFPRLPLRIRYQHRCSPSLWPTVPGFRAGETSLKPKSSSALQSLVQTDKPC